LAKPRPLVTAQAGLLPPERLYPASAQGGAGYGINLQSPDGGGLSSGDLSRFIH